MTRLACLLLVLGGCGLYWNNGGGGADDVCAVAKEPASQQLRDPETGQCETIGGGYTCGPCEPCPAGGAPAGGVPADWASCDTMCLGVEEQKCLVTAGCQTEYLDKAGTLAFWGCFAVAPSGPVETPCDNLDAYSCSRHDNCKAIYTPNLTSTVANATIFERCVAEITGPPPPPPTCDTLTAEADCVARGDCEAIYNGYDCTCDPTGCTCKTEVFARCQAR
jgi:hypothetical protein